MIRRAGWSKEGSDNCKVMNEVRMSLGYNDTGDDNIGVPVEADTVACSIAVVVARDT